ncbi:hypothetical protein D3C76_25700 [compost metagenome]
MAIHLMIVGFGQKPVVDNQTVLTYLGFNDDTAGKPVDGVVEQYDATSNVPNAHIVIATILDKQISSSTVTMVFQDAFPEDKKGDENFDLLRIDQIESVLKEFLERIGTDPETFRPEYYNLNHTCATLIPDAAPMLTALMASANKPEPTAE